MRAVWVAASVVLANFLVACSSEDQASGQQKADDSLSQLDDRPIEEIAGNDSHNLLARGDRLERGMALAAAVKGIEGKQYCSPIRTLYLGKLNSDSFWSVECHDNSAYQVQVKKDGSGSVMDCAGPKALGIDIDCWKPFEANKQKHI